MGEPLTVASAILTLLGQHGVRRAFGIPGVHNLPYWDADGEGLPRIIGVRHEQTAAYAADGLHRATGEIGAALLTSGNAPPLGLALREDLRTRIGWGLVYELKLLSDDEKGDALRRAAAERGVAVSADVVPWMLTHRSRDIRALIEQFDALDRYAFERKRPITLPLVREWLQREFEQPFGVPDADR